MEYIFSLIACWFGVAVGLLAASKGRALVALWREPVMPCPVLIVESDDWGPGPDDDAVALNAVASMLASVRDRDGHPAVMTLGVVGSIPDAAAMIGSGNTRYIRRTLDEPAFRSVLEAMRDGCRNRVFALQRHGLEHFWPPSLLARLRDDSGGSREEAETLRRWTGEGMVRTEGLPASLQSRWIDCARLPSVSIDPSDVAVAVREEADLLRSLFGAAPDVAVPNTFVWGDAVEQAWASSGVRCIVTPGQRYEARDDRGKIVGATRRIRNNERAAGGIRYVVRDVYFEPVRGHRAEQVWDALAAKVAQGRPALLETHRANFIGSTPARDAALRELERLLRGALERHPDLRFMSTGKLAEVFHDAESRVNPPMWRRRFAVWCARVGCEPGLERLLKYSGLRYVLRAAGYLVGNVTYRRTPAAARC